MLLNNGIHFDLWANKRVLEQLKQYSIPEAQTLLSHICHAQEVWINRIHGETFTGELFQSIPLDEIEKRLAHFHTMYLDVLQNKHLEDSIHYTNLKGEQLESLISDILFHVIIHGQHHRAQLASLIRQAGFNPLPTDYIFYTRFKSIP